MKIESLSIKHSTAFKSYVDECVEAGIDIYKPAINNYEAFIKRRLDYAAGANLPEGYPPMSMYLCLIGDKIAGAIRVRHGTNQPIKNVIGHIGYETRPSMRNQGVASSMLKWVADNVLSDEVLIVCERNNIASHKVIQRNGGKLLNHFRIKGEEAIYT